MDKESLMLHGAAFAVSRMINAGSSRYAELNDGRWIANIALCLCSRELGMTDVNRMK